MEAMLEAFENKAAAATTASAASATAAAATTTATTATTTAQLPTALASSSAIASQHDWIYVLECEHGCVYVGQTGKDPNVRLQEHRDGRGSAWTRLHPPR